MGDQDRARSPPRDERPRSRSRSRSPPRGGGGGGGDGMLVGINEGLSVVCRTARTLLRFVENPMLTYDCKHCA